LLSLVLLVMFLFKVVYFDTGLREYIGLLKNISEISDVTHRDYIRENLFNKIEELGNVTKYGGVLASAGRNGVWIWANYLPRYYRFSSEVRYSIVRNCNFEILLKFAEQRIAPDVNFEKLKDYNEWKKITSIGAHVFVYIDNNQIVKITTNPDVTVTGYEPVFCQESL